MTRKFISKRPHYEYLKKRWTGRHRAIQNKVWEKHKSSLDWLTKSIPVRQLAVSSLGSLMLLAQPVGYLSQPPLLLPNQHITAQIDENQKVARQLFGIPKDAKSLTNDEEKEVEDILSKNFNLRVSAFLEGIRLNRSYGIIGGEQHLYRFPGDNLYKHAQNFTEWAMYGSSGIAPALGAWGYFTPTESEFSEKDKMREKYYLAVQTFLAPGFAENVDKYRDFFKFRKMLVVNAKTGQAVVAVVGDAGPAEWTGKHLGGSPEVMHYLGLASGPRQGPVFYFFIDDPQDQVPLGPKII